MKIITYQTIKKAISKVYARLMGLRLVRSNPNQFVDNSAKLHIFTTITLQQSDWALLASQLKAGKAPAKYVDYCNARVEWYRWELIRLSNEKDT